MIASDRATRPKGGTRQQQALAGLARVYRGISRLGWGVADQGLSSLTNFLLGIAAVKNLTPRDFGAFSIAFGVYTLALGTARALTSEPLMVRFSGVSESEWRTGVAAATGTATLVASVAALGCFAVAAVTNGALASALAAMGVMMPGLLIQDGWRFAFFSSHRGAAAFVNDLVWAGVLACAIAYLVSADRMDVFVVVLAWGGSASVAALVGILQSRVVPAPRRVFSWFRRQADLAPRFTAEFGLSTVVTQLIIFAVGAMVGLTAAGAIRAGQLLLGPLTVVYLGVSLAAVPEAIRTLTISQAGLKRVCRLWGAVLAAAALGIGFAAYVLPDQYGTMLLGPSWDLAHTVVLPLSVNMAGAGIIMGASIGLRALAAARLSLRARLFVAPVTLAAALLGTVVSGVLGAAWGIAAGSAVGSVVWWHFFRRALREHQRSAGDSSSRRSPDTGTVIAPEGGFHA